MSLVGVGADIFLKIAGEKSGGTQVWYIAIGAFIYFFSAIGWFFAMRLTKLSSLGVIYSVVTLVALAAIGVVFFGERLSVGERTGIVLGLVSVALLARFG